MAKAIGLVKKGKGYRMVFGSVRNPRIGTKAFKTKKALKIAAGVIKDTVKRVRRAKRLSTSGLSAKRLFGKV